MDSTIEYYERNAEAYALDTAQLELDLLYGPFLALIRPGGRILDVGCGPGRDSKAFLDRGYNVVSFDASVQMADLASERTGQRCCVLHFDEMEFEEEFDGIWASASLLHIRRSELDDLFRRILRATTSLGVIYMSFKHGTEERMKEGRLFSDFTEDQLSLFVVQFPEAEIVRIWQTADVRTGRSQELWVNGLVRKVGK